MIVYNLLLVMDLDGKETVWAYKDEEGKEEHIFAGRAWAEALSLESEKLGRPCGQVCSRWQTSLLRGYKGSWRVMIFIMVKHSVLGDLILIYKTDNELILNTISLTEVRLSYYSSIPFS